MLWTAPDEPCCHPPRRFAASAQDNDAFLRRRVAHLVLPVLEQSAPSETIRRVQCGMAVSGTSGSPERGVLSADSFATVERLQIDAWRRMSPVHKARTVDGLTRTVQVLALAGIRQRHPDASERECFLRLSVLKLGSEATRRLYPDAAALLERSA